jgi:hypothetical protein
MMVMTKRLTIACSLIILLHNVPAIAGEPGKISFPKGTFTFQTYATDAGGLDNDANVASGTIGCGYFVFDNLSLGVEASGYHDHVSGQDAYGYGISGVLRDHIFRFQRTTIFSDVLFGPTESTSRIPAGGTDFNFITRTGIGITHKIDEHLHLLTGVRYFHLSNARIEGPQRNPSINGIEGYIGLMWTR